MKDKDLMKLLMQNGWELKRIQGSHHVLQKGCSARTPKQNIKKGGAEVAPTPFIIIIVQGGFDYVVPLSCCFPC